MKEKENKEKKFDINEIYTPLSAAKEEIWKRWNNKELRKKVDNFLGGYIPDVLKTEPHAFFARHVITPNNEYKYFCELAELIRLKPLGWEYLEDKFFTVNQVKLHLGKIISLKEACNNNQISSKKIINFRDKLEGKKISDLHTIWNENLVDFHHRLATLLNISDIEKFDASKWYKSNGNNSLENYKYFFALFICYGVLFESFLTDETEKKFTSDVVISSFNEVKKYFGIKPLIVPLLSKKSENNVTWYCHPEKINKIINELIK
jgi:hypothetical protein